MALIEKYRQCTAIQDIDPASEVIKEGMLVTITSAGVKRVAAATVNNVYGIAGDTFSTSGSAMPGVYAGWQGRVSDGNDETKASGKVTVYHSGGEFATDQFLNTGTALDATKIGTVLIAESTGILQYGYADVGACIAASKQPVAMLTLNAAAYPSGVPGVDVGGDNALKGQQTNDGGTTLNNLYIEIKLLV
jgi:hypothetical protein